MLGFEDIVNFAKEHGRPPMHGEDRDIFERLYAVRLDRLREQPEFHALLAPFDELGLLSERSRRRRKRKRRRTTTPCWSRSVSRRTIRTR